MIKGLFETHINVHNLERSMAFYQTLPGLTLGHKDQQRRIAFYWIGGWAHTMLGIWEKPEDPVLPQHFAFEIDLPDIQPDIADLQTKNIPTHNFFGEQTDMPSVFGWVPAASIYFPDPDGHELEYIAKLPGPPKPEEGIIPWDQWQQKFPLETQ